MHTKLQHILKKTKDDLAIRKRQVSLDILKKSVKKQKVRPFLKAITRSKKGTVAIIGEIKFASPTQQSFGSQSSLLSRVKNYQQAGIDAVSVVTEKHFFQGDPAFIVQVKHIVGLPILQKDFIIDEYQIYECAKNGADALLLIARFLSKEKLTTFVNVVKELGMEPIVEVHNESDLKKAVDAKTNSIAVNARDLDSFIVDVNKACRLLQQVPDHFLKLGFSGIISRNEVQKYKNAGASAVLIGTSLMKAKNSNQFIQGVRI